MVVDRDGSKHVHLIVSRPFATDNQFQHGNDQDIDD